mgnify:CR=1 FL=1
MALGNDSFKDQVAALTGRRLKPGKRGPNGDSFYSDPKFKDLVQNNSRGCKTGKTGKTGVSKTGVRTQFLLI